MSIFIVVYFTIAVFCCLLSMFCFISYNIENKETLESIQKRRYDRLSNNHTRMEDNILISVLISFLWPIFLPLFLIVVICELFIFLLKFFYVTVFNFMYQKQIKVNKNEQTN